MLLLSTSNLPKLLLRNAPHEAFQTAKDLMHALCIHHLPLRPSDQRLDLDQALLVQMHAQPLVHLREDLLQELFVVAGLRIENLVHVTYVHQFLNRKPLAHDQRLVRLGDAQPLHKSARGAALSHQAQTRKRREEERVGRRVDEVGEGGDGGREADGGAVQGGDEDLGMRIEGMGDVQVV